MLSLNSKYFAKFFLVFRFSQETIDIIVSNSFDIQKIWVIYPFVWRRLFDWRIVFEVILLAKLFKFVLLVRALHHKVLLVDSGWFISFSVIAVTWLFVASIRFNFGEGFFLTIVVFGCIVEHFRFGIIKQSFVKCGPLFWLVWLPERHFWSRLSLDRGSLHRWGITRSFIFIKIVVSDNWFFADCGGLQWGDLHCFSFILLLCFWFLLHGVNNFGKDVAIG